MGLLDGGLASDIAAALGDVAIDVTLTREEEIGPGPNPWDPPITAPVDYQCLGWLDAFDASWIAQGLVQESDVRVIIIATSLATTPVLGDALTVGGQTFLIAGVRHDPALATWDLVGRA
ncbi:hypothetical protein IYW40_11600 [Methylocystis sp. H4A]|uniref:hypothetical protein n=1 Tax=Methylocystis sp. H4A TaxID=2785788 RepID=UPI0018C1E942|nr:hypothetical protein [Methylocystis sp. H4A]MBG0802118.1 hypothetical protein [Methylocystis sp. H4A]